MNDRVGESDPDDIKALLVVRDFQYKQLEEYKKEIREVEMELYKRNPNWYKELNETWDYDV